MPNTDREWCDRIRRGDASAVDELLFGQYAAADLLASAAVTAETDPRESVALAFEQFIRDVVLGLATDGVRGALLGQVVSVLDERGLLDTADLAVGPRPRFLPPDDRWSGWWADDPAEWPPDIMLTRDQVLCALHQVPLGLRVLLILRDAAGISAEDAEPIVHVSAAGQAALLDTAREAYIAAMDTTVES